VDIVINAWYVTEFFAYVLLDNMETLFLYPFLKPVDKILLGSADAIYSDICMFLLV
jgi:hypothetical protein